MLALGNVWLAFLSFFFLYRSRVVAAVRVNNKPVLSVKMSRRTSRARYEDDSTADSMCIPGIGGEANRPKPRMLGTSFFGYVPDAFAEKTPHMPSERMSAKTTPPKTNSQLVRAVLPVHWSPRS